MTLLTACEQTKSKTSSSLYNAPQWPSKASIIDNPNATQKSVAKYVVKAKAAYDGCVLNLEGLRKLSGNVE